MKMSEFEKFIEMFVKTNNINMNTYFFYEIYHSVILDNRKKIKILKIDDTLFLYYIFRNKNVFNYLPFANYNIIDNKDKYLKVIHKIKNKFNDIIIYGLPNNLIDVFTNYKKQKLDNVFIYDINNFLKLKGNKYKHIRNEINYFVKNNNNIEFREFNINKDLNNLKLLFDKWKDNAKKRHFRIYDSVELKNFIINIGDIINDEKVINLVLYSNDKMIGFTNLYIPYRESNFVVAFIMKTDIEYKYSSTYLFYKTFEYLKNMNIKKFNFGSDLGEKQNYFFKNRLNPENISTNYRLIL